MIQAVVFAHLNIGGTLTPVELVQVRADFARNISHGWYIRREYTAGIDQLVCYSYLRRDSTWSKGPGRDLDNPPADAVMSGDVATLLNLAVILLSKSEAT